MRTNDFRNFIITLCKDLKNKTYPEFSFYRIPIIDKNKSIAWLRLITKDILKNDREIRLLAKWRNRNQHWFPTQFKVTFAGTKKWAREQLIEKDDRILFFIETDQRKPSVIGHIGLNRFDYENFSCQIDNVIRGKPIMKGIMTRALKSLTDYAFSKLKVRYLTLTTFTDNKPAIALYKRCGFKNRKITRFEDNRFNLEMILRKTWVK